MSVIIKGEPTELEAYMINGIKNCQLNHIKFANIVFGCETIEDADRTIFRKERKGKWIKEREEWFTDYPYKCTNCGKHSRARYYFCPNCGADMRGDG